MDKLALGVSILALVVSVIAAVFTGLQAQADRQMARIEKARHEIEVRDRRAKEDAENLSTLRCSAAPLGRGTARLCIENDGPAVARDVELLVSDLPPGNAPQFIDGPPDKRHIAPGSSMSVRLFTVLGTGPRFAAHLTWVDGSGPRDQTFEVDLN